MQPGPLLSLPGLSVSTAARPFVLRMLRAQGEGESPGTGRIKVLGSVCARACVTLCVLYVYVTLCTGQKWCMWVCVRKVMHVVCAYVCEGSCV